MDVPMRIHTKRTESEYGVGTTIRWHINGKLSRPEGPALIWPDGDQWWYRDGLCHRDDGPAQIGKICQYWCQEGVLHREEGPAVLYRDGAYEWMNHGKFHRLDGPARFLYPHTEEYWIHGVQVTREDLP